MYGRFMNKNKQFVNNNNNNDNRYQKVTHANISTKSQSKLSNFDYEHSRR